MADRMRAHLLAACALLLSACASAPPPAPHDAPRAAAMASFPDKLLDLGTAYEQGTFHRLGRGLCDEVNKARERTQVRCVAYPTSGPDYNLQATAEGVHRLGMAFSAMSRAPLPDSTRHLLTLYDTPVMIVARRAAGITDLRRLQGKQVELGPATSGRRLIAETVLDALGVTTADVGRAVESATTAAMVEAFCRGELDLIIEGYGLPDAAYERLLRQCGGELLTLPEDISLALQQRHPGLEPVDLPVGRYTGRSGEKLRTLHQQVILVTDEKVGSEALTRFIVTMLGATAQLRKLDPHLADFDANSALAPLPQLASHAAVQRLRASLPNVAGQASRQPGSKGGSDASE
jgi:TRAP transporter TAXI family solute receptor